MRLFEDICLMKDEAIYRNDYPLLSRSGALSQRAATMEALIISKIQPCKESEYLSIFKLSRSLIEIHGICDAKNRNYVDHLKKVAKELLGYMVSLPPREEYKARWRPLVSRFDVDNSGMVTIGIDADLAPYLMGLQKNFTKVDVIEVASLKNKYAKKIYMLVKSFQYKNGGQVTIEELHGALGISSDSSYQDFKMFNRSVLLTAKKEINEKSDIIIDWKVILYGRKTGALEFSVKKNPKHQPKLPIIEEITDNIPCEIRSYLDLFGYNNDDYINQLIEAHRADVILIAIQIFDKRMKSTSIKNKAGLFHTRISSYITQAKQSQDKTTELRERGIEESKIKILEKQIEARKTGDWEEFKISNEDDYTALIESIKADKMFAIIQDNNKAVDEVAFSIWLDKREE